MLCSMFMQIYPVQHSNWLENAIDCCHNGNELRNATCADAQISIEWPYCSLSAKNQLLHFTISFFGNHNFLFKNRIICWRYDEFVFKITILSVRNTTYLLRTNF